jgi:hypothetical protein
VEDGSGRPGVKPNSLRSAWQWWIGDAGRQLFVWLVWLACTVALVWYVNKTTVNFPSWEEWLSVPELLGEKDPLPWFLDRLQEHRYTLGRVTHWLVFHATGGDFRAGCYASVALTSVAVVLLLRTAKRLRGRHHYGDVLLPLVFLNPGASENFYLGYQMAFAWDVLLGAWLISIATRADDRLAWATAWRAGVTLTLLSLGGWIGLAFVPPGCVWLAWLALRSGKRGWLIGVWAVVLLGFFGWSYWELQQNPLPGAPPVNDRPTHLRVLNEYLAMTFGPRAVRSTTLFGVLAIVLLGSTILVLLWNLRKKPNSSLGWLVVLGAVLLMGYGLAQRRGNGFAMRNLPLLGLATTVSYFTWGRVAWSRFGTRPLHWLPYGVSIFIGMAGGAMAYTGWTEGLGNGSFHRERHKQFERDRDNGMSLRFLASKHFQFPEPDMVKRYESLHRWGHPSLRGVPMTPAMVEGVPLTIKVETKPIPNDPSTRSVVGQPTTWVFQRDGTTPIAGVRLVFRSPNPSVRLPIEVLWMKPDGSIGTAVCLPWVINFVWTLDFPIDTPTDTVWLRTWSETDMIQPVKLTELIPVKPR